MSTDITVLKKDELAAGRTYDEIALINQMFDRMGIPSTTGQRNEFFTVLGHLKDTRNARILETVLVLYSKYSMLSTPQQKDKFLDEAARKLCEYSNLDNLEVLLGLGFGFSTLGGPLLAIGLPVSMGFTAAVIAMVLAALMIGGFGYALDELRPSAFRYFRGKVEDWTIKTNFFDRANDRPRPGKIVNVAYADIPKPDSNADKEATLRNDETSVSSEEVASEIDETSVSEVSSHDVETQISSEVNLQDVETQISSEANLQDECIQLLDSCLEKLYTQEQTDIDNNLIHKMEELKDLCKDYDGTTFSIELIQSGTKALCENLKETLENVDRMSANQYETCVKISESMVDRLIAYFNKQVNNEIQNDLDALKDLDDIFSERFEV